MDCQTFKQRLSEFLDRQLGAGELALAETHMAKCSGCRAEYEDLKGLSRMVAGVGKKPLPVGFMQRLERRRREQDAPAQKSYYLLPPGLPRVAAFAMSSLIVMVVVYGKARQMTAPVSGMISGAASDLAAGGGGFGGGGPATNSFDALSSAAKSSSRPVPAASLAGGTAQPPNAADSVVPETARMLRQAAGMREDEAAAAAADAKASVKRSLKKEFATGSVTSMGQKLARARGEPVGEASDGGLAMAGGGGGGGFGGARPLAAKAFPKAAPAAAPAEAAPADRSDYTNEEIAADIEAQKKKMGIRKIIPPGADQPPPDILQAMALTSGRGAVRLQAEPSATTLAGDTPMLIAASSRPSPYVARGHATRIALEEAPAAQKAGPLDEAPGVLIHSEAERQDLWHKYELTAGAPNVDYASQMLAVVFATNPSTAVEITRVTAGADQVVIGFHELPLPAGVDRHAVPTYQLRVIPKTDKPVVFEKLP